MRELRWAAVFAVGLAATGVRAEDGDPARAREAFQRGVELFEEGEYDNAAERFRAAYAYHPSWKIQYNIGQCMALLKRYGRAVEAFELYLVGGGDEVPAERRDQVLGELERLKMLVGKIDVRAPEGALVVVDGEERGTVPLAGAVRVSAGINHQVVVRLGERTLLDRQVRVGGGDEKLLEASAGDGGEQGPAADGPGAPTGGDEGGRADGDEGVSPAWFWVALGGTAAFGATTIGLAAVAESKYDDAVAAPGDDGLRDSGKRAQAAGIAFLALTGAAAVTTGVLAGVVDFGGEDEAAPAAVSVAPYVNEAGGGVAVGGRF